MSGVYPLGAADSCRAGSLSDLVAALARSRETLSHRGYAYEPAILREEIVSGLLEPAVEAHWIDLPVTVGAVTQLAQEFVAPITTKPLAALVEAVSSTTLVPLGTQPELTYMRYESGIGHISPHRDSRKFVGVVVVLPLQGNSTFAIHSPLDRSTIVDSWSFFPQDAVFMAGGPRRRGAGVDRRPTHSVSPPADQARISLTIRYVARNWSSCSMRGSDCI